MFSDKGLKKPHVEITSPSPTTATPPSQQNKGFVISFSILGYETHLFLLLKKQLVMCP